MSCLKYPLVTLVTGRTLILAQVPAEVNGIDIIAGDLKTHLEI